MHGILRKVHYPRIEKIFDEKKILFIYFTYSFIIAVGKSMENRLFRSFLSAKDIVFECGQIIEKICDNEEFRFIYCTWLIYHCCRKIYGFSREFLSAEGA